MQTDHIQTLNTDKYIETAPGVKIYTRDYGSGKPVILIHGWPLTGDMWEYQMQALVDNGNRVIAYDRRGFGHSSKVWNGYDYDTLTDDLASIIEQLDLSDITLVGFSMGSGEVARYFSKYGGKGVSKVAIISGSTPFMLKTDDNHGGVPQEEFDKMVKGMKEDRIGFMDDFGKTFFGMSLINHPLSAPLLDYYRMLCSIASPRATLKCAESFSSTDMRSEMPKINVPALVIHGEDDKTVPIAVGGEQSAHLIPDCRYLVYAGAPHGLFYTHKEVLNKDLIGFINS